MIERRNRRFTAESVELWSIGERNHAMVAHEVRQIEPLVCSHIVAHGRPPPVLGEGERSAARKRQSLMADDALVPAHTCAYQTPLAALLDLDDLCQVGVKPSGNEAAPFLENCPKVVTLQCKLAEVGKRALTAQTFVRFGRHPKCPVVRDNP